MMNSISYGKKHQPPKKPRNVQCLGCGRVFVSSQIRLDEHSRLYVGPCWPECKGHGYGLYFFDESDPRFEVPLPVDTCQGPNGPSHRPNAVFEVKCVHCGHTRSSDRVEWDPLRKKWVCKMWGECDGDRAIRVPDGTSRQRGTA